MRLNLIDRIAFTAAVTLLALFAFRGVFGPEFSAALSAFLN